MIECRYLIKVDRISERLILIEVPLKLIDLHIYRKDVSHVLNYDRLKYTTIRMNRNLDIKKILGYFNLLVDYSKGTSKYYLKIRVKNRISYHKKLSKKNIVNEMIYISLITKEHIRFIKKNSEYSLYNFKSVDEIQILSEVLNKIFNDNEKLSVNMNINDYLTLKLSKELLNQFLWNS